MVSIVSNQGITVSGASFLYRLNKYITANVAIDITKKNTLVLISSRKMPYNNKLFFMVVYKVLVCKGSTKTTKNNSVKKAKMCLRYTFPCNSDCILHGKISPK